MQVFAKRVIKNRPSVMRNSRKSLLPKQVFSIILSLMVFNCYNLLIFCYISRRRCFWKLFVFPVRNKWECVYLNLYSSFFLILFYFLHGSMPILTLGNPSCHRGFVWRILTVRAEQSDLLPARWQSLSVGTHVSRVDGTYPGPCYATDPSVRQASVSYISFRRHSLTSQM